MRRRKLQNVHIWFLDDDLTASAQMLTDKCLGKTINGCIGALTSVCMYFNGVRNKKVYSYLFSKENADSTLDSMFYGWPFKRLPSFSSYSWKESKWCRMCHENFDLTVDYLSILLDEHIWRHSSMHVSHSFLDWIKSSSILDQLPYARLETVVLPWKSIDLKFRSVNIVDGYRK